MPLLLGPIRPLAMPVPFLKEALVHSLVLPFTPSLRTSGWFPADTIEYNLKPAMLASAILAVLKTALTVWPGP